MLPELLNEDQIRPFKFWFNQGIHDGMSYHNELFYRWYTTDVGQRAKLYHFACKLSQRGATVVLTVSDSSCSFWISLRSRSLSVLNASDSSSLPSPREFKLDDSL